MPRLCIQHQNQPGRFILRAFELAVLAACFLVPSASHAQKAKKSAAEPEKKTGTIAEVEKKGKASNVTVEQPDGEKFDILVTSKTKFVINGKGDAEFLKHPKVFVKSDKLFAANNQLFGKAFTVYLGNMPDPLFQQDPDNAEVYHVAGTVVDCDDASVTINAGDSVQKVNFEQGASLTIDVESTEPEHAPVGAEISVEGTTRLGKFHPTAVVVTLDKPLVADEVFAAHDHKKPGKSKTATKTAKSSKKPAKGEKDDPEGKGDEGASGEPVKPSSDPFGVLNAKDSKDSKKKKKATGGAKPRKKPADDDDMN